MFLINLGVNLQKENEVHSNLGRLHFWHQIETCMEEYRSELPPFLQGGKDMIQLSKFVMLFCKSLPNINTEYIPLQDNMNILVYIISH